MKDIKTKTSGSVPRTLSSAARTPKELVRNAASSAKEKAMESAERQPPQVESPEQYAENRLEHTADNTVHRTGQEVQHRGKQLAKKVREAHKRHGFEKRSEGHSSYSSGSNAYRAGQERARHTAQGARRTAQNARYSGQAAKQTAQTAKAAGKGTVKTVQRTVKAARTTVKSGQKAVKTAQRTAKTAQKTAQATARAAQIAARAARAAAKAAAAAAKAVTAIVKAIIAAVKALIVAIAAGGWVAVLIIIVVAVIALILGSAFGIFFSDEAGDGIPISQAVTEISADFQAKIDGKIDELSSGGLYDEVKIVYEGDIDGDSAVCNNWTDVLTVFAVKYMGENVEVITITPEKVDELKNVFYEMNELSTCTETIVEETTVTNDDDEEETVTHTTLIIYVKVNSLTYEEGAAAYNFTTEQIEIADEMMSPDYYTLYAELLGVDLLGGADLTEIISNLPLGTEGAEVVKAAVTKLGAPYVMGAKGPYKFDCSGLAYWAINEVDPELGSIMYTNAAGQAKWCIENGKAIGRSELQPGDLIFWQNLSCPGCSRWNEIHHVGIYVGDGKAIEASSSRGCVVIRDLWENASYPIYAFARPYV
ncbi:MAG: NlpC/P60 family protein [Christensenellales bacterium]